ncbi:MAG: hypothetical protein MJZ60_10735 [Bacteroidaceae bacterium]|nr:hypothetical protein [Bacteroidaceae bacterium]
MEQREQRQNLLWLCRVATEEKELKQDQSQACLSYGLQGGGKPKANLYYYNHYSFWTDIKMIFATVLGKNVEFVGEEI